MTSDPEQRAMATVCATNIALHGALSELLDAAGRFQREPFSKTAGIALLTARGKAKHALAAAVAPVTETSRGNAAATGEKNHA